MITLQGMEQDRAWPLTTAPDGGKLITVLGKLTDFAHNALQKVHS